MRNRMLALTITVLLTISSFSPFAARTSAAPQTTVYSIEDTPVWRMQLEVTTNVAGAGSGVEISLNSDNKTRLYPAYSNLGTTYRYDLLLDNVRRLRDIAWIRILQTIEQHIHLQRADALCEWARRLQRRVRRGRIVDGSEQLPLRLFPSVALSRTLALLCSSIAAPTDFGG